MKIHTILRRINQTNYRSIAVFGLVVMLATTMSTSADAQTGGLLKYLSSGPSTGLNTHTASSRPTQISNNGKNYRVVSQSNVRTAADTEYRGRIGSAVMNASNPAMRLKATSSKLDSKAVAIPATKRDAVGVAAAVVDTVSVDTVVLAEDVGPVIPIST